VSEAARIQLYTDQEEAEGAEVTDLQEVIVLDDASAEYLLKRLREAEDQYKRMESWYDFQKAKAKEIYDRTRIWVENSLRPYFDMVPTTGKKIRTYDLPGGTMKLSKQEPKWDVKDEEMVPWLEKNGKPEMVAVKKEARWGEFKKTLPKDKDGNITLIADENGTMRIVTKDGEIVPGVTATIREDKFSVNVK